MITVFNYIYLTEASLYMALLKKSILFSFRLHLIHLVLTLEVRQNCWLRANT